ncbi:calpain-5-like [Octopus sinensis]|uniref:Calpain-5-like n=1 Tax=Octopus sinensis TaxID=2607531 RepID=A0A6P7S4K9_9MOLL|nr:calpain-5-like [Octopus sinensis]
MSCLANYKDVWNRVIPDHETQDWNSEKPEEYAGIFHFRFWRYGEWLDVVIDDQLPTRNGQLLFIHSKERNEFWSALLEKAYAKLFGNYEVLDGGELAEALEDFTGGVSDTMNIQTMEVAEKMEERTALFERMKKEMDRNSLMAASIPAASSEEMEATLDSGLVKGHAYGLTCVKNIHLEGSGLFGMFGREKMPMVRLRNPWGQCEWKGAFSDGSPEWQKIDKNDRSKIGLTFEDDGEFWMTFEDFSKHFVNVAICRVVNTSIFSLRKTWSEGTGNGEWKKPGSCGGCINNKESFLQNPQYAFDVSEDEDEVMVQLMQKTSRTKLGDDNETIGCTVIKVEENRRYRIHNLFYQEVLNSTVFRNSRSIFFKDSLKKGRYVIIPCTFKADIEGSFLLRVYTSSDNSFKHLIHDQPVKSFWQCFSREPVLLTRVKVLKAVGLEKQDDVGADPYCVISCEREKVYTKVVKDTTDPDFNSSAIFYRRNPDKSPLKVQIWNNNLLKDEYMGKHVFTTIDECDRTIKEVELFGRGKEGDIQRPGKLLIEITNKTDFMAI